jgi:hypothetical protein
MGKFKLTISSFMLLIALLVTSQTQARTLLSDAPFPWGTEIPYHWPNLHGTWVADTGTSQPLVFKFRVAERDGGIFLVTSQVLQQYRNNTIIATGYAFVIADQKFINIPYFGEGAVPLAILRKYPANGVGLLNGRETLLLTWVWDVNTPTFVHRHYILEKISNESEL